MVQRLKTQLAWARAARRNVEAMLKRLQASKQNKTNHRMTSEFLSKCALSWPAVGARSFAGPWHDLVAFGSADCSHPTICKVRAACAEVVKDP